MSPDIEIEDLDERNRLFRIIHKPLHRYYLGDSIGGLVCAIIIGSILVWFLLYNNVPGWGWLVSLIALLGISESMRQRERLNAFFELYELDMRRANKPARGDVEES